MNKIELEKELCIVTLKTLTILFSEDGWSDSVALYMFYYKQCKLQQTDSSWSTDTFCKKWLQRWNDRLRKAKKLLKKYDLIAVIKNIDQNTWIIKGWYIRLNYYNLSTTPEIHSVDWPTSGWQETNAYIKKKEMLIKKKEILMEELNKIVIERNKKNILALNRKWLPKVNKINNELYKTYIKKRKEYEVKEIWQWINNYLKNIHSRDKEKSWTYFNHRFTLLKFLKQTNWLDEFINYTD